MLRLIQDLPRGLAGAMTAALAVLAWLGLSGPYPLFHLLAELASVVLGLATFVILFNARRYVSDPRLHIIGASFFFCGLLDLLHAISYKGMNIIPATTDTPTQLWVAARGIQAAAMLAAPMFSGSRPGYRTIFHAFLAVTALAAAFILWWDIFPSAHVEGTGLTRFKITAGYAIAAAFAISIPLLKWTRPPFAPRVTRPLCVFLALMALAELLFTAYSGVFDPANLLGHLVKVAAYGFAYAAFNYCAFEDPLNTLFQSLRTREEELEIRGGRLIEQSQAMAELTKHPAFAAGDMRQAARLLSGAAVRVMGGGHAALLMANAAGTVFTVTEMAGQEDGPGAKGRTISGQDHPFIFDSLSTGRAVAAGKETAPLFVPFAREVFRTEGPGGVMAAGIRRRGRLAGVLCHLSPTEQGEESLDRQIFLASLADLASMTLEIQERNLEKLAREESEERLAALIQAIPDQVCFKDDRGRWLVANPSWLRAHGIDRDDYRGFTGAKPGSGEDLDGNPTSLRLQTDAAAWTLGRIEYCMTRHSRGEDRAFSVLKMAVGPPRQPRGLLTLVRDVTSHRHALEEVRASNKEIQALNETLEARVQAATDENRRKDALLVQQSRLAVMGEMIGNIAHQWRQPLNALGLLVANMLLDAKEGSLTSDEAAYYQKHFRDILAGMSRTIDDFRNFFKPDNQRRRFTLDGPAREALSLVEASIAHHGIRLETDLADAPPVWGFRGEFSQVALNLLANARDAVSRDGRRGGRIILRSRKEGDEALLEVQDDGGGVPPEAAPRVFDPYYTTKPQDKGTGLGLYMSKRIIEDHMGGRIFFENADGGAIFRVRLPLAREEDSLE